MKLEVSFLKKIKLENFSIKHIYVHTHTHTHTYKIQSHYSWFSSYFSHRIFLNLGPRYTLTEKIEFTSRININQSASYTTLLDIFFFLKHKKKLEIIEIFPHF